MSNFKKIFLDAIDKLEVDAKAVGMTLTSVCRETNVSRATPDRWRKKLPTTIQLLTDMQEVVERKHNEGNQTMIDGVMHKMAKSAAGTVVDETGLRTDE